MRISNEGIALIKRFEGLELEAYRDAVGILTIGYGHTGDDVFEGQVITEAEAEAILRRDLDRFEVGVNEAIRTDTAQSMFDAFVSLSFNIGTGAFKKSTALKRHNKGDYTGAAEAITWWNKAGGQVLTGLVRRRAAEEALYLDGLDEVTEPSEVARANVEENQPRRSNPVTTRTTAGAGTAGAAGAAGAGAVLMDGDEDETETETTDPVDTGGTDAGETSTTTGDAGTGEDTGSDTGETDTDPGDTDAGETDTGETDGADTGPGEDTDTGDATETGTLEDDDTTTATDDGEMTETTEVPKDDPAETGPEIDQTEAIVVLAGAIAVVAALYVIVARIDDWLKYRR